MAEKSENHQQPFFRPSKRRKVFAKRTTDDDQDKDERQSSTVVEDVSGGDLNASEDDSSRVASVVRRPAAKKHGIGFSSSGAAARQDVPTETALVPVADRDAGSVLQSDRFTKPTGDVGIVEDKHLTAYVDSKLAELRSSSATPLASRNSPALAVGESDDILSLQAAQAARLEDDRTGAESNPSKQTSSQQKGYPYGSRTRNKKPRRQRYVRDASDIARDAMVDEIMKESQVPLYDQADQKAGPAIDNDEAAEEAFKAQFLIDLEQRKRHKPPAPPANAGKAGQQVPTGPKLGGSRSQREKMRALEEAKNAAGKK